MTTKDIIIKVALRLFSSNGYEKVSIRDIANAVGIQGASIYNHFISKEQILEACYDFYIKNRFITRATPEQYKPIIKNGTKKDVLSLLSYSFAPECFDQMIQAVFIVFSRIYTDARAREIYTQELETSLKYVTDFLQYGIEIKRFKEFDTYATAAVILSTRIFTAQFISLDYGQVGKSRNNQNRMFDILVNIIPFNY